MRTTLMLEDDVYAAAKQIAENSGCSLGNVISQLARKGLTADERDALKGAVIFLSEKISESKEPEVEIPAKYKSFVLACGRQTDNIQPRKIRFNSLYDEAF